MKYKEAEADVDQVVRTIRSKDVVLMKTIWDTAISRYLVIQIKKAQNYIDVLPLEQFFKNPDKTEAPILSVPFYMIEDIGLLDKGSLLFLADQPNPHILQALEGM